jgi:hypothetical protein
MAWTTLLKAAPWKEIVKIAVQAPDFVREFRKGREGATGAADAPAAPPTGNAAGADTAADIAQLRFEIELVKTNLERLRGHSEQQAKAFEAQSRQIAESFAAVSARLRTLTWIAFVALLASIAALAITLLR